ncbi:MAG: hypothetical protein JXI32_05850 [Deltaproteobacteria bacterium]|nr:hypothetical protein [Deltaproteobacteria bacterium]
MDRPVSNMMFDQEDHELLVIVNEVLGRDKARTYLKSLLNPYLHPHGIKEMAASKELRVAYAVIHLLNSLDIGKAEDRLGALRSLRDEVLYSAQSFLRRNTARVLLQIMKKLVQAEGDYHRQLELAHDFRMAASGKPRIVREQLKRYHLIEMPEEWNQIATDDHVHDINTKGRKSPTHLIMDAWIKGIRRLKVVYYNHVPPPVAGELLKAAEIMGIRVRIGVEFSARFYDRYVSFIWAPRGLIDAQDFLNFLKDEDVASFMAQGRNVSAYQQRYVTAILKEFNERHRYAIEETYGFLPPLLNQRRFFSFVGAGQASLLHLAEFTYTMMLPAMREHVADLQQRYPGAAPEERARMVAVVDELNELDSEAIVERYLRPASNPSIPDPHVPSDGEDVPDLLKLTPRQLLDRLGHLNAGYSITLSLSNLHVADVIELLYDCQGLITHLEAFNLKDYVTGVGHDPAINDLQRAINEDNIIVLKRIIRNAIRDMNVRDPARADTLTHILHDISTFRSYYQGVLLKSRVGSDSSGRSHHLYGMGLVIRDTLPRRAQREIMKESPASRLTLPLHTNVYLRASYHSRGSLGKRTDTFYRLISRLPGMSLFGKRRVEEWEIERYATTRIGVSGNVVALGGMEVKGTNDLSLEPSAEREPRTTLSWQYLNSTLKNWVKVLAGFVPAFFTFYLTKEWWLLAWFGGFIWFGITGARNIIQSVLGSGGIRRSPLLKWNNYVSWDRLTDSLLFTGFSVPLLDYIVKTLLLDRLFGITTATSPVLLYTVMALANGLYLFGHNIFRGLQRGAAFANLFRTILSIPIAVLFNMAAGGMLAAGGYTNVDAILQKWAAIISKGASDCVAGLIEGIADRYDNIRTRMWDYRSKLTQVFDTYTDLEILFPESDICAMLESPKQFLRAVKEKTQNIEKVVIINALDLLYFWMYQPRARSALLAVIRRMSAEERRVFVRCQSILAMDRGISQLFVDGLVGKNFSRALSFYLDRSGEYLATLKRMDLGGK